MPSLKRFEGYLLTDHSQGPGLGREYPAETLVEEATIGCIHCGGVYRKRKEFDGTRCYCRRCDRYVCNPCARTMALPSYVHRTFADVANLIRSGGFRLEGPMSNPILIPILKEV